MNAPDACAAIIPCLNEEAALGTLIPGVCRHVERVIVIDDGSTDHTADVARSAGAEVIRHPRTLGKGAALRAGWERAREAGCAWALCLDGDGQHAPADIPKFLTGANAASLVVGNRMANPTGMPFVRRQVNRWMSRRLSALAGMPLPDSQCGFRLVNLGAWAEVTLHTRHFEVESELLVEFAWAGHPVAFVPIEVIYKGEQSKINPFQDTLRWLRWWQQMRSRAAARQRRLLHEAAISSPVIR